MLGTDEESELARLSSSESPTPLRSLLAVRCFEPPKSMIFLNLELNVAHIRARETFASQYLLMPQQRPETSYFRSGFFSLDSIQLSRGGGMLGAIGGSDWRCRSDLLFKTDIDNIDCDSGSV